MRALLALVCLATLVSSTWADEPASLRRDWSKPIGGFSLLDLDGQPVDSGPLRGKVWIAHFFYPTCQGPCTKTVPTMRKLQDALAGKSDYVLVSIALNGDSPELLRQFAQDQGADPRQWVFLTGEARHVQTTVQEQFFQTAQRKDDPKPGDEIDHTTNLLIIDREGNVRGHVDGQNAAVVPMLVRRLREVAGERYLIPAGNAALNSLCTVLLVIGWVAIKRRRETMHKAIMLLALAVSMTFLACYVYYHFGVLDGRPTWFPGGGWIVPIYYAILASHIVLAMIVAPMALYVAWQGLRDHRPRHVRVARWTLPLWLYVSVTGVVVYVLLYQVYPPY